MLVGTDVKDELTKKPSRRFAADRTWPHLVVAQYRNDVRSRRDARRRVWIALVKSHSSIVTPSQTDWVLPRPGEIREKAKPWAPQATPPTPLCLVSSSGAADSANRAPNGLASYSEARSSDRSGCVRIIALIEHHIQ